MHRPKALVIISPTESPRQDVYKSSFVYHLRNHFDAEVVGVTNDTFDMDSVISLRDGYRASLDHIESLHATRRDIEYAAFVMPTCIDAGVPGQQPSPVVIMTVRTRRNSEWAYAYPIEGTVPVSVAAEVTESIAAVLQERNTREGVDPLESITVRLLIDSLRHGVDGALDATLAQYSSQIQ